MLCHAAASVKVTLDEMNNGAAATLAPALAEPVDSLKLTASPDGKKKVRLKQRSVCACYLLAVTVSIAVTNELPAEAEDGGCPSWHPATAG